MKDSEVAQATQSAFLWTRLLSIPFWVLLNMLPIILYKDLHITPWLVTAMIVLKPTSALLASYWGTLVHERRDRLVANVVWANILRYLPFLFLPWIESPILIIAAFGNYMMLSRGVIPAWMEIFKLNLEKTTRSRVFAYGSALDYIGTALLPVGLGLILDDFSLSWRIMFPLTAILGLAATVFVLKLPPQAAELPLPTSFSFKEQLVKPWKEAWHLLKTRPDFAKYQWGFMLGGAGLMVMQPIIPIFFVDVLALSYTEMMFAMGVCKAVGYAAASPFAIRLFNQWNIYTFSALVSLLAACFPLFLISSPFHPFMIYFAYILYGIMQAGSELSWHMSGPHFARDKESSLYSMTNVLLVGVRGCFAPPIGNFIFAATNSTIALIFGSVLCTFSAIQLLRPSRNVPVATEES